MNLRYTLLLTLLCFNLNASSLDDAYIAYTMEDYNTTYKLLKPLEDEHRAGVSYLLGTIYMEGNAVKQDIPKALKLLEISRSQKHSGAVSRLIDYYTQDDMNSSSLKYALLLQQELDDKNSDSYKCANAEIYRRLGEHKRAFSMFKSASKRFKVACATYGVALMYERGEGVKQNTAAAKRLYEIASKQRHSPSQYRLALIFLKNCQNSKDLYMAKLFLKQALKDGILEAKPLIEQIKDTDSCSFNDTKG